MIFSTLYTSLPLHLVKRKLIGLVEKTFAREKTTFVVVSKNTVFFSDHKYNTCLYWSCEDVCDIKSRPVLHHCVVIFFWSSEIMECTCMLFTFENGVPLMR